MAKGKVGQLYVALGLDSASFTKGFAEVNKLALGSSKEIERSLSVIQKSVMGAAAALPVFAATWVAAALKSNVEAGAHFFDLSKKIGLNVETLSAMQLALEATGVTEESFGKGVARLNKAIFESSQGNKEVGQAFKLLGINVLDASGKLRTTEDVLLRVADAFQMLGPIPERGALAIKLFGKAGAELIPLLDEGSVGLQKFMDKAREAGLVMSGQTAQAAKQLEVDMKELEATVSGFTRRALTPVIGALRDFTDGIRGVSSVKGQLIFGAEVTQVEQVRQTLAKFGADQRLKNLKIEMPSWTLEGTEASAKLMESAKKAAEKHAETIKGITDELVKHLMVSDQDADGLVRWKLAAEGASAGTKQYADNLMLLSDLMKRDAAFRGAFKDPGFGRLAGWEALTEKVKANDKAMADAKIEADALEVSMTQPPELLAQWSRFDGVMGSLSKTIRLQNPQWDELRMRMESVGQQGLMSIGDAGMGLTSWKNVARQIIADLGRMLWYLLVVKPLMNAIFGGGGAPNVSFGDMQSLGQVSDPFPHAEGGDFGPMQMIRVGERGPETLFTGSRSGTIVPKAGVSGGLTLIQDNRGADFGTVIKLAQIVADTKFHRAVWQMQDHAERTV